MDFAAPEVIIASSKVCSIHDSTNGNVISSYKDENPFSPKTLCMVGDYFLIAAYSNKPFLKVWTISKSRKQEGGSFPVPGIVSALTVSNCGYYCVAGIKEDIYVWEVSSGAHLSVLHSHYQTITCLKFAADDSCFFSGAKDGNVMVWIWSSVIDVNARRDTVKPHFKWKKHSAVVTDIYCGPSVSRVATTSLDMTCNIYELDSGLLLSTIFLGAPLTSVVMDLLEYFVFLGDEDGYVHKINIHERLPSEIHKAGGNTTAAVRIHKTPILSLSISSDGARLMALSDDSCKSWNLLLMSCTVDLHCEGKFNNAFFAAKPVCLSDQSVQPRFCFRAFKKGHQNDTRKFIETSIQRKELSLMYEGCPDKFISNSFLSIGNQHEKVRAETIEHIFEDAVHGPVLDRLMAVNHQLYATTISNVLDEMYEEPTSSNPMSS